MFIVLFGITYSVKKEIATITDPPATWTILQPEFSSRRTYTSISSTPFLDRSKASLNVEFRAYLIG